MVFKELEIQGFKSFPDKVKISFDTGVTGVVGPNGSGKSNLSDAVRWVLGETSSRQLRAAGKMEDVIFGGTRKRSPMGFAQVRLTLDNAAHTLDVDADEVTIGRKYYRSGDSEYTINGQVCRLKDVYELLLDTGIGRDGYSVIGQGRIAEIVAAKSSERREIFEEACGIAKYRYRKTEAERRLAAAGENLERLRDILGELESRVGPLEKESAKAQKFLELSAQRKTLEVTLWTDGVHRAREAVRQQVRDYETAQTDYERFDRETKAAEQEAEEIRMQAQQLTVAVERLNGDIRSITEQISGSESRIAVLENDILRNEESAASLQEEISAGEQDSTEAQAALQRHRAVAKTMEAEGEKLAAEIEALNAELARLADASTVSGARKALVLVPEISLTPQMILRLKSQFGRRVAVQHSALNHTERLLQWQMIQDGGADIVVGTRSAVFSPLENIGLIIIDEEQEHTYRSESAPRYSAHEVARQRAAENGALLLLASATPSTESFYAAQHGRTQLVRLTQRYGGNPLPSVQIVDMRAELAAGNPREISLAMEDAIRHNLEAGKQTILLLNRRGYQTVAQCEDCREVLKCTKCSVPMVYHKAAHKVLCHYCGSQMEPPTVCPACGGKLQYRGFGTQKAEEELAKLFPDARVLRMDQDSTAAKDAHEKLLAKFARHEYDIMVGTQMVAKGLDFEDVTLVGVLGIDSLLFAQGFRAYENVFSLITQVVGRSGRAKEPGFAIIQTTDPDNPVLTLAAAQDYDAFYEQEIAYRKLGLYPPFCGLCIIGFAGAKENEVARAAARFSALLGQQAAKQPDLPLRILGPTPGSIEKINDTYRYKLTVKCRNDRRFRDLVRSTLALYEKEKLPSRASVVVDLHSDGDI